MVLTAFSSGARHKTMEWEYKHAELQVDERFAVAFTAFADVWPRAAETEMGAALCAIGAGRTLTFGLTSIPYWRVGYSKCCLSTKISFKKLKIGKDAKTNRLSDSLNSFNSSFERQTVLQGSSSDQANP